MRGRLLGRLTVDFGFISDWIKKWHEILNQSCNVVSRRQVSYLFCDSPDVVWFKATAASYIPHSHIIGPPSVLMHIPTSQCARLQGYNKKNKNDN